MKSGSGTSPFQVPQDLHVHTTFSSGDGSVVPEQTVELVARVRHARVLGISDHFEHVFGSRFDAYQQTVRQHGLRLGIEVNGARWVEEALDADVEYYVYHCYDTPADYRGAERLLAADRPVIIAHPMALDTDLEQVPDQCLIEINNRYVWRDDWRGGLEDYTQRFRFVISSDAHQPHWLNQNTARYVAAELRVKETLLFDAK